MNESEKNNNLINPMVIDNDKTMADKRKTWDLIFLLCPDQAEFLIKEYEEKGPEVLSKAEINIIYNNPSEMSA